MPSYLVTGAGRGLGYGLVQALSKNPDNVVLGLVRNKKAVQARLDADGLNVHLLEADITDSQGLQAAAQEAEGILGSKGLDALINNAAYVSEVTALRSMKEFEDGLDLAIEDTQKSIEINVYGVLKTVYAFLPLVRQGSMKKVVVISSGMGDIEFVNESKISNAGPYAASKATLSLLVAKLAADYEEEGILFMSLCPGLVDSTEGRYLVTPEDQLRLEKITVKTLKYSPGLLPTAPVVAAQQCLAAIERSSLEGGFSGSFLSHNGTKRWM